MAEGSRKNASKTRGRGPGRPFQRGNAGRPRGSKNKVTRALEAVGQEDAQEILKKMAVLAKRGSVPAAKVVLDRFIAPVKDRPVQFDVGKIQGASDAIAAMGRVAEALGAGQLTPDEATSACTVLAHFVKAVELIEIERRVADLERRAAQ